MSNGLNIEGLLRKTKRMKVVVLALSLVVGVLLSIIIGLISIPSLLVKGIPRLVSRPPDSTIDIYHDFNLWSIDRQVKESSIILRSKYVEDRGNVKCVIVEALKLQPNSSLPYKIGDEMPELNIVNKGGVVYGDGQVVFFVGNPGRMQYAISYSGQQVGGGDGKTIGGIKAIVAGHS